MKESIIECGFWWFTDKHVEQIPQSLRTLLKSLLQSGFLQPDSSVTHLKLVDDDSPGTGGDGKARVKPKKSSRQLHHSPTASFTASHWTRDRCGAFWLGGCDTCSRVDFSFAPAPLEWVSHSQTSKHGGQLEHQCWEHPPRQHSLPPLVRLWSLGGEGQGQRGGLGDKCGKEGQERWQGGEFQ